MLGMTPAKAVKHVELKVKPYPKEEVAREGCLYRYLYKPGKLEDDNRRRETYMIVENPGHRVLYYLADGPRRAFRRELPPNWLKKC